MSRSGYVIIAVVGFIAAIAANGGSTAGEMLFALLGKIAYVWGSIGYVRSRGYNWAYGIFGLLAIAIIAIIGDNKKSKDTQSHAVKG